MDTSDEQREVDQDQYDFWVHDNDPVFNEPSEPSDGYEDF